LPVARDALPERILDPRPAVVAPPLAWAVGLEPTLGLGGESELGGREREVHERPSGAADRTLDWQLASPNGNSDRAEAPPRAGQIRLFHRPGRPIRVAEAAREQLQQVWRALLPAPPGLRTARMPFSGDDRRRDRTLRDAVQLHVRALPALRLLEA